MATEIRNERVGRKPQRSWESLGRCRWRAARAERPLVRRAMPRARQLGSMTKKSPTLVCRLSTSLTTKTLEHVIPAYNLPRGRAGQGKVAKAAQETAEAEAPHVAQVAQAAEGWAHVLTMRDAAPLLSAALVCSSRHRHAPKEMAPIVCGLAGATLVARMMRCPRHSVRLNGLGWARPQRGPESLAARVRFGRA
jgi:hypothetical protein